MAYAVSKKTLLKTEDCDMGFKCLEKGRRAKNGCRPAGNINGFLRVDTRAEKPCAYHTYYGTGHICMCPTGAELYKKYSV